MINMPNERQIVRKDQIISDLRRMGLAEGDHVAVALSFKSIGFVEGGPEGFIDALLSVVGSKGTIMMNAHTSYFPVSEINPDYVFDCRVSTPVTGALPEKLLKHKGAVRSRHPTFSVVAVGHLSEYLTDGHDESSRPYLPFEKLAKVQGKCLFIGIDGRLVAIRHEAQRRAGLFIVPMLTGVKYKKNNEVKLFVSVMPPCVKKLPELNPRLEEMDVLRNGKIGNAPSLIGLADNLLDSLSSILKDDPSLNLCDDLFCLSCRELERRLHISTKYEMTLFQKTLRQMVYLKNRLTLLRKYSKIHIGPSRLERSKTLFLVYNKFSRLLLSLNKSK